MKRMTVRNADAYTLDQLYAKYADAVEMAASLRGLLAYRAKPACDKCIDVLRQFLHGKVATDDVKAQFRAMTFLCHEVDMNDAQTLAVLCLAEVAHAAAHLGHLVTSMSHQGKVNREYDSLQRAYVMFGLEGSRRYAARLLGGK